ncbi:MAG: hypothetical protein B1H09_04375 [Gemmatimonadaceae bacterium 4484_173]|nr:MAG: hypothetical protein B1H09_04375 [Gemmatimonadaceae bacterium 4484_173]RKZ04532.1 MAG: hypothetical protein DRQ21_02510 [Candidatus Fermentibacteria bacterium]
MQELGEKIEMICHFAGGGVTPCRFRWQNRVYHIVRVSSSWESRRGTVKYYHYVVRTSADDVYEIHLNTETMGWVIDCEYSNGA